MKYILFFLFLFFSFCAIAQESTQDANFKKEMEAFKEKLKQVKTPQEGLAILAQMQARQQEYLKHKLAPANNLKTTLGVDQAQASLLSMQNKTGNAKYENNPLYTKCKVIVSYTFDGSDNDSDPSLQATGEDRSSGNFSVIMTAYLLKYMGKIVLQGSDDAVIDCSIGGSISKSGSRQSATSPSHYSETAGAVLKPLPIISLNYESTSEWSAAVKVFYKGQHQDEVGSDTINTELYMNATNADGTLTTDGDEIDITKTINEHKTTGGNGQYSETTNNTGTLSIKIMPPPSDKYVAYFEPVGGEEIYKAWMPEGYVRDRFGDKQEHGNYIDVKIKLVDTTHPGVDCNNRIKYIVWSLPEVSRVPGYADNAPSETEDQYKNPGEHDPISRLADMQLKWTTENPDTTVERLHATGTIANNYTIRVYCYDWGAFAKLEAHVVLVDSTRITAKARDTTTEFLLLPKRSGTSKIADYFKIINKATKKADDADDEKLDALDRFPGDGFTLYEEYRGWIENGKHIRGDPNKKDVMILDDINTDRSRDGISFYETALNEWGKVVKTHYRFTKKEFGLQRANPTSSEQAWADKFGNTIILRDKCLNFNYLPGLHAVDQHGIVILETKKKLGFAVDCPNREGFLSSPKYNDFLVISADFSPEPDGYATVKANLNNNGDVTISLNGTAKVITDEYATCIAHEMFHYSGVNHHGNRNSERFSFKSQANGLWTVNGQKDMKVYWEDNPNLAVGPNDPQIKKLFPDSKLTYTLKIDGLLSTCSGNEDCIMRYDDAFGYIGKDLASIYLIKKSDDRYGELTGIHLCKSKTGTGVNDKNHLPQSRYGDAEYGDCFHQFCINDKYADAKLLNP